MAYVFAGYTFDRDAGLKFGAKDVALPPKERALLHFLLCANGKTVSKDEVVHELWHGGAASDESISRVVYRLRLAMQASGGPPVVSTVYNGGFRITAVIHAYQDIPRSRMTSLVESRQAHIVWPMLVSGREFAARQSPKDIAIALQAVTAASSIDPAYVPTWIAIAELHVLQAMRNMVPPRQAGRAALKAVQRVFELSPEYGPGLAIRGWVRALVEGELRAGLADLDSAMQQDPEYWVTCLLRAWVVLALGDRDEALAMARRAHALNSFSMFVSAAVPQFLMYAGQTAEALQTAQALALRFPGLDSVQEVLSIILCVAGRMEDALACARRAAELGLGLPLMQGQLAYVLARLNRVDEVRRLLDTMEVPGMTPPYVAIAVIWLALGERERALSHLRQAKEQGIPQFFSVRDDPRLGALQKDAVFRALWE